MTIDAEALFRQLGITSLIPIPHKPESDLFAKALDKQIAILDAIDWNDPRDTAAWKGAWFRFVDKNIHVTFRHRNKIIFGTYQVNGNLELLQQALEVLRDAARYTDELELYLPRKEHQPSDDYFIFCEPEPDMDKYYYETETYDELEDGDGWDYSTTPETLIKPKHRKPYVGRPLPTHLPDFAMPPSKLFHYVGCKTELMYNIQSMLPRRDLKSSTFLKIPSGYKGVPKKEVIHTDTCGKRLIEPFVGSAVVFLNFASKKLYNEYLCADWNQDLINLFMLVKQKDTYERFVNECKGLFIEENYNKDAYIALREEMNSIMPLVHDELNTFINTSTFRRTAIFLWIMHYASRGAIRYNTYHAMNVGYDNSRPYYSVPMDALQNFHELSSTGRVKFVKESFEVVMNRAALGDTVYCDPPYIQDPGAPKGPQFSFDFTYEHQEKLRDLAIECRKRGVATLISNNDNEVTRALYKESADRLVRVWMPGFKEGIRYELLALYDPYIKADFYLPRKGYDYYRAEEYDEARDKWRKLDKTVEILK